MKPSPTATPEEPAATDPESRLIELQRRVAEEPHGRWFLPLASLLLELEAVTEAQRAIRQGLARDPDCMGGWVLLGRSYLMSGEVAAARRILTSVLARDPENAHALRGRAAAEAELGESEAAIGAYRALLRLVPGDVGAQEALAKLLDHDGATIADRPPVTMPGLAALAGGNGNGTSTTETPRATRDQRAPGGRVRGRSPGSNKTKVKATKERRRRPAPPSRRQVLPPAPRPRSGIFESLPADLDWQREPSSRPAPPEFKPVATPADPPSRPHQGYRRWLDRLLGDRPSGDSKATAGEPGADA